MNKRRRKKKAQALFDFKKTRRKVAKTYLKAMKIKRLSKADLIFVSIVAQTLVTRAELYREVARGMWVDTGWRYPEVK